MFLSKTLTVTCKSNTVLRPPRHIQVGRTRKTVCIQYSLENAFSQLGSLVRGTSHIHTTYVTENVTNVKVRLSEVLWIRVNFLERAVEYSMGSINCAMACVLSLETARVSRISFAMFCS